MIISSYNSFVRFNYQPLLSKPFFTSEWKRHLQTSSIYIVTKKHNIKRKLTMGDFVPDQTADSSVV